MRVPLLVDSDLAALVLLGVLGCITMLVVQKNVPVSAKSTNASVTFPKTALLIVRVAGLGQGLSGGEKARARTLAFRAEISGEASSSCR